MELKSRVVIGWSVLAFGILCGVSYADDSNGDATSADKPQANTSTQKIDGKKHPVQVQAVSGPSVGRSSDEQGSSMGVGISIPLGGEAKSPPKKQESEDEDSD